jgi:hypothetical protein
MQETILRSCSAAQGKKVAAGYRIGVLEEFRDISLFHAMEVPRFAVLRIARGVKSLVDGIPHRLMLWANGPGRNFTFDAITVALNENAALVDAALVNVDFAHDLPLLDEGSDIEANCHVRRPYRESFPHDAVADLFPPGAEFLGDEGHEPIHLLLR